ncbi:MAG: HD domain-containing phosphohydrolase [Bdellovibrionales bacterium]
MNFTSIRVSSLRGDQKIDFDVYVEIGAKQVLYLRKGSSFEGERLQRLRAKKLKKMYINVDDESSYREYLKKNIDMAYDAKSSQSMETRTQVIQGAQQAAAENVLENPTDESAYLVAKEGSEKFADFLMREQQAIKGLLSIENQDHSLAHHGVSVSSLAVELAKKLGVADKPSLSMIALGGLVHDLGHQISGLDVARPVDQMSEDDRKIYFDHPHQGVLKVKDLNHMDLHVSQIIAEHEENCKGTGFPDKSLPQKQNPFSAFVQTANGFDRLVTFENMKAADAIKFLAIERIGVYPLEHIKALKAIGG